jgi:hypothetical protein
MKKILPLILYCSTPLYAATATVSTPLSYPITPSLGMYCGTTTESGPSLGPCSTVNLGLVSDNALPAYFSGASTGYYEDDVTFTTNNPGGGVNISGSGGNNGPNYFQLAANVGGATYCIPYYITYQHCTQPDRTQAVRIDPSAGTITIPASGSSLFSMSGSGTPPCTPANAVNPGNGSGALYFYVNNGNEVTAPIPADTSTTYQDTLTLTVSAT